MARKLRLRYSQAFVARAMAAHPKPRSLLALVEVARRMGIKTTPAKTDAAGLAELTLPAVVHFTDVTGEGGFGILEVVSTDGYVIWDSVHGPRALPAQEFLSRWSGVVVLMERSRERGVQEHRYRRQRLLEILGGGTATPALVDGPAAGPLRSVFAVIGAVLLAAALLATPLSDRLASGVVLSLAMVGLLVTVVMAASIGDQAGGVASRICRRGKLVDCHGVLTSRYSRAFGIPLSDIGIAFYGSVILLVGTCGWLDHAAVWRVSALAFTATIPFAALLVALQISMKQFCTLCMASHVVNAAGAAAAWLFLWTGRIALRDALLGLVLALYFGLVLFVAIPYVRRSRTLATISARHRRVTASPFGTLAHVLSQPATDVAGERSGVAVDGTSGDHEVVLFVHPGCGKCLPVLRELLSLAPVLRMRVFVGAAPKDPTDGDRRTCSLLVASWLVSSPDRIVDAYLAAKKHLARLKEADGAGVLGDELGIDPTAVVASQDAAGSLVRRAERAVHRYAEGTPAIFFDSRPFEAPLSHLAYLVENHPELLRPK